MPVTNAPWLRAQRAPGDPSAPLLRQLHGRLVLVSAVAAFGLLSFQGEAGATTLCFDDPREVIGVAGGSCCLDASLDSVTSPACGARLFSCSLAPRCELTFRAEGTLRVVDDHSARAVPTPALLWAGHRCCVEGTLRVRDAAEVTVFAPHPLACSLEPGCRIEVELPSKYELAVPPEVDPEQIPWAPEVWDMFVACATSSGLGLEACTAEWILPTCASPICAPERRDQLEAWLEKILSRLPEVSLPEPEPGGLNDIGEARLFTDRGGRCCVPQTLSPGPYHVGGAVFSIACEYAAGCVPSNGDVLAFGDAQLLMARGDALSPVPAVCASHVAARDARVESLEAEVARAEERERTTRQTLQRELGACEDLLGAARAGGTSGGGGVGCPGGVGGIPMLAHDRLVMEDGVATMDLLAAVGVEGAEIIALSPTRLGISVWQPDGVFTYFAHPSATGAEVISYQVRDPSGQVTTVTLEVVLP